MVTSVNVWRPTSISGLVLSEGGSRDVGTAGTSFFIKAESARLRHRTMIADISGDSDLGPRFLVNYWLYADWLIRGWAVAGQAIGIANLKNSNLNPTDDTAATYVSFDLANDGSRRIVKGRFFVHDISIEWSRRAPYVGLSMALRSTVADTTVGGASGTDVYQEATS